MSDEITPFPLRRAPGSARRPEGPPLTDRPVGLAAWIDALFQDVPDSDGEPERVFALDATLDDAKLHWLPNAGASSARICWEGAAMLRSGGMPTAPMRVPAGISMFPKEQVRISKRWAERRFANLVHFNELDRGGHFAAMEQPELFATEVRATFRGLRA